MVKIQQVEQGLALYIDNEIFPQLADETQVKKYGVSVISACAIKLLSNTIKKAEDNAFINMLGIIDGDNVEIEMLLDIMKEKMPEEGFKAKIPIIGNVAFNKNDIDLLRDYIIKGAVTDEQN